MKAVKTLFALSLMLLLFSAIVFAGDFDWFRDFNKKADADPSGFRARLETRFRIGDAEISAVLSNVERPSDAYIVLRFGEMSQHPIEQVIKEYNANKDKGWGVIAKNLGIKPGSSEFHALKRGHDLVDIQKEKGKSKGKGKRKG